MASTYEFKITPPNERSRVVRIEAATLEQAVQSAERLWCRQMHPPILLCVVSHEPQQALAFL
jgi:hypothetical protein